MVIGLAEPHPSRVITVNGFEDVNAVSAGDAVVHDERDVNAGRPESHLGVDIFAERKEGTRTQEKDKKPMSGQKCTWKEGVDLAHLPAGEREEVLHMLEPHRGMWDGRLGAVAATTHRIAVTHGSKPVHFQPYRAGSRARVAENKKLIV
jgi:hypothetical protein